MQNKEFFEKYGTNVQAVEDNLQFMLQEFWEKVKETEEGKRISSHPPFNTVSFIKNFMKEETIMDVDYMEYKEQAELAKQAEAALPEAIDVTAQEITEVDR